MRDLRKLNAFRIPLGKEWEPSPEDTSGAFAIPSPVDRQKLLVIASTAHGWDHVSVSRRNRCPNWDEMETVKRAFFEPHEVAMQLHVTPDQHISIHPNCLHLWRPQAVEIPLPPLELV